MMQLAWDANADGLFTISDVWLILKWLACFPGNLALNLVSGFLPKIASFFEIGPASQYGGAAWTISVFAWIIAWLVAMVLIDESNGKRQA